MNLIPKRKLGLISTDEASAIKDTITLKSASIGTAVIQDATITDAKISTCSISKLTAGNLTVTGTITTGGLTTGANGVSIKSTGINIWGANNALTTRATEAGTVQCAVNSSGQITAGAGKVILDATGIIIGSPSDTVAALFFKDKNGVLVGNIKASSTGLYGLLLTSETSNNIYLGSELEIILASSAAVDLFGTHVRLPNHATGAASPEKGDTYYDTDDNKLKVYTGAAWEQITST